MNNKVKLRDEIDEVYKWDLKAIYNDISEFEVDYKSIQDRIKEFSKYEKTMINSPRDLENCVKENLDISRCLDKLYSYASLLESEDTSINSSIELKERVLNLYSLFSVNSYFIRPNLLKMEYEDIEKWYEECPSLREHDRTFKSLFRYKSHTLSEAEEKLLSNLNKSFGSPDKVYSTFTNSDLRFGNIVDENGDTIELTDTNYRRFIESNDRRVRKDAFKCLYETYKQYKNTIASIIEAHVKENNAISKIKNYDSMLEKSLFPDEVSVDVYNNLIDTVSSNLDVLFKYFKIKKDILNLGDTHLYDLYTSIIQTYERKYSYDEAKDLVKNALSVLGEDYSKVLDKAFNESWIDVYPNKGKTTGAYSGGSYDTKPYILLNYLDNLNNVSTLAHELGHSVHSYYTRKNNTYEYGDYAIIIAEVASTVNELLLARYMINNSTSKEEKIVILDNLMELFKGTIYRQTMFAEFEKIIYEESSKDKVLTADYLCDIYYNLNKKYFGNDIIVDEEIKYEWERIPHFYYNFYVYKYATGLSAACHIVNRILNNEENAVSDYLKFLSLGSSVPPLEALKVAGVDLTKKETVESAISMFNGIIEEFKEEYNK